MALGLRVRGVPRAQRDPLVRDALRAVGLEESRDKIAGSMSGGERQRVAVARALVTNPTVILADEPTGALDSDSTARLVELLRAINASGTTVVVVTHDPIVADAADRVVRIVDGILGEAS